MKFWYWLVLFTGNVLADDLTIVVLDDVYSLSTDGTSTLKSILLDDAKKNNIKTDVLSISEDFADIKGSWTIRPILKRLLDKHTTDWFLFVENEVTVRFERLFNFLNDKNSSSEQYYGYPLKDEQPTIIHHFYGYDRASALLYPDFSAGVLFSRNLLKSLNSVMEHSRPFNDFYIDPKHELARYIVENLNVELTPATQTFCLKEEKGSDECSVVYKPHEYECFPQLQPDQVYIAVKTFHGNHKTRVVVVKRTWAKQPDLELEFISDIEDHFVPTITLGVGNTNRGHCGKTFAIFKHFMELQQKNYYKWLVIADDDTLLSTIRLNKLLSCYDPTKEIILGERYGYGFSAMGDTGYDYPTGGAAMVFSVPAVKTIAQHCSCPNDDSPDDMIIGLCAVSKHIAILHSHALHQARPMDYDAAYISKLKPISFHKFEDIDPYVEYDKDLREDYSNIHNEL